MYIKVIISGSEDSYYKLDKKELILGRSSECDLKVSHLDISRKHVKISISGNTVCVTDLNATNGISIGGDRISPMKKTKITFNTQVNLSKDIYFILLEGAYEENDLEEDKLDEEQILDFTMGEDKTVMNMDLSSILSSLKSTKEANEKLAKEPASKNVKQKKTKKVRSVATSKSLMPIIISIFIIFGVLIWKKDQVFGFFLPESPIAVKLKKIKEEKVTKDNTEVSQKDSKVDYSYILDTVTCQTDFEQSLCKGLSSTRKLSAYEGALRLNNEVFLIIDAKNSAQFYKKNLVYNEEQLIKLANYVSSTNKKINLRRFQKNKFVMSKITYNNYNQSYISFLEFIYSSIGKELTNQAIENVTLVLLSPSRKISYTKTFTQDEVKWLLKNDIELSLYLKYYFISGISRPIDNFFKTHKTFKL